MKAEKRRTKKISIIIIVYFILKTNWWKTMHINGRDHFYHVFSTFWINPKPQADRIETNCGNFVLLLTHSLIGSTNNISWQYFFSRIFLFFCPFFLLKLRSMAILFVVLFAAKLKNAQRNKHTIWFNPFILYT